MNAPRATWLVFAALLATSLLASCTATQPPTDPGPRTPGFWLGLWHGVIAPVTLIISLFSDAVRVYAFPNAGRWYEFGFVLGVGGFSGGIFAGSTRGR